MRFLPVFSIASRLAYSPSNIFLASRCELDLTYTVDCTKYIFIYILVIDCHCLKKNPFLIAGVVRNFEGATAGRVSVPPPAHGTDGRVAQRLLQNGLQTHFSRPVIRVNPRWPQIKFTPRRSGSSVSVTAASGIRVNKGKLRQSRNNPCRTGSAD